jgi:uncharacterized membrane protein
VIGDRIPQVVQKAPYISASGTGIAVLTLSDWGIVIGIIATILTCLINWHYKRKDDKRRQVEHDLAVSGALERRKNG